MITVEQARAFLLEHTRSITETEQVDTLHAAGRVLAEDVRSSLDVPGYDNSAMDGYALGCPDPGAEGETRFAIVRRIAAGDRAGEGALGPGQAARIFTGAPIPEGADTVVMQEQCRVDVRVDGRADSDTLHIAGPISRGMNIRPRGNDIRAGSPVLPAGARLTPQALGLIASIGLSCVRVFRPLRVAILSSGNEIAQPGTPLQAGQCYDSNRHMLFGLLASLQCEVLDLGTIPDDLAATRAALLDAARSADVVITSGGVSVGEEDYIKRALESIGRLDLWRIAVKPGKPLAYGRVLDADFIGLPGNPVSVLVTFCLFVRPMLSRRQGAIPSFPVPRLVSAGFGWPKAGDRREYVRARLVLEEDGISEDGARSPKAILFQRQGSDVLSSVVWADGLVEIPPGMVIALGDKVSYLSFAELLQ